ncbi:MAG: flavodoxin [Succiniclasticum sp.]|jgi:menaquinone-dependent protoporphyrinogen IX oxidase|nr:flavodoxin [Succiniclasticum sp.]MEE3479784.1 flavodoxin [Succiniclasticum sp.]
MKNALVAYYSASGCTRRIAEAIAKAVDGTVFEIAPAQVYTDADLNYRDPASRVCKEHDDVKLRSVALKTVTPADFDKYEKVFVCYPIWWGIAAWPVDTFVKGNDFTGKTVLPVATSAASPLAKSGELLKAMAKGGDWKAGIRFASGASDKEVADWAKKA